MINGKGQGLNKRGWIWLQTTMDMILLIKEANLLSFLSYFYVIQESKENKKLIFVSKPSFMTKYASLNIYLNIVVIQVHNVDGNSL